MSSIYQTVETAIENTLLADSWLGDTENIKLIETGIREQLLLLSKISLGFHSDELPAIQIKATGRPGMTQRRTTAELDINVPVVVKSVCRDTDKSQAETTSATIVENIERVLREQKSSEKDLGIDAVVSDLRSTDQVFEQKPYFYAVTTTECLVGIIQAI